MIHFKNLVKTGAGLVAAAAMLANCSPSANEDGGSQTPASTESSADSDETGAENLSREERVEAALAETQAMIDQALATNGPGSPALWKLADEDTTIHIFGTVHILKPEIDWRTDTFNQAFNAADKLVFEIDLHTPEGLQAVGTEMIGAAMFQDGRKLSDVLSESDKEIVANAAQGLGIPLASMDPVEPWFAALSLANAQFAKDGFDPESGVEMVLVAEAQAQEKSFDFLETAALQAGIFDNLEMEAQIDMLVESAMTLDLSGEMLDTLTAEWSDGDVSGLGLIAANPDAAGDEAFYNALFKSRNENWVPQIEAMLDEPGTVMIAVGAGHLAGQDSVITMLEAKGHTLTRVQ